MKKKILAMVIVTGVLLVMGITAFAAGTTLYETDFSEANGWFWQNERADTSTSTYNYGFDSVNGAYADWPYGSNSTHPDTKQPTKLSFTGATFKFEKGKTYEISFMRYSGQSQTHYFTINIGNNTMYVRSADGATTKFGSSASWWADDCYHPGISGWYNVKYRFTIENIIGSDGTTVLDSTGIQYMEFYGNADSRLQYKNLNISVINDYETEKTIADSSKAIGNQKIIRQEFSSLPEGNENGEAVASADGALNVSGTGSYCMTTDLKLKKGSSYRISYFAKTSDSSGFSVNLNAADGYKIKPEGSEAAGCINDSALKTEHAKNGKWEHYCYFLDVEDIVNPEGAGVDECSLSDIEFELSDGTVIFDNYYVVEYNNFVDVSAFVSEGSGTAVLSGDSEVAQYGDFSCVVTPEAGSRIKSVSFAGEDITSSVADLTKGGTLTLSAGKAGGDVKVSFEEIPLTPGFVKSSIYIVRQPDYEKGYSIISYAELSDYNYGNGTEFGIELTENTSRNTLTLPAKSSISENKTFAVRVYGKAITASGDYKFVPYVTVGDETIYGDEATEQ